MFRAEGGRPLGPLQTTLDSPTEAKPPSAGPIRAL